VALDATLRAAACRFAGRPSESLKIHPEDLREKIRRHRSPYMMVFVLDNSWSVHVDKTLEATKGVVLSFLKDAKIHKDKISLVAFRHSRKPDAALKLIRFLTQTEAQVQYARRIGLLPAVVEALNEDPFTTDRLWRSAVQAVKAGRVVPITPSWGLMEDRLATEFAAVWQALFDQPTLDLVALLARRLEPLARRLEQLLARA